jgi:ABC-type branched-subunit amino acid transport system ATPase component
LHRLENAWRSHAQAQLRSSTSVHALELAHRAYVMDRGRVVKSGEAAALVNDPAIREAYMGLS